MNPRTTELRAWAAWNDRAMEAHGTEEAVAARREANRIADRLGDFTEADWGVIRNAQRGYMLEVADAFTPPDPFGHSVRV